MKKILRNYAFSGIGLLLVWNGTIAVPVALQQLQDSDRPAYVLAYRSWLLSPTDITINLIWADETVAPIDLYAVLSSASEGLEGRSFRGVHLNRWHSPRLLLEGDAFAATSNRSPNGYMQYGASLMTSDGVTLKQHSYSGGYLASIENMSANLDAANNGALIWLTGHYQP